MYYKREERRYKTGENGLGVHDYVCSKDYLTRIAWGRADMAMLGGGGGDGGGAQGASGVTFHDGHTVNR